MMFLQRCKLNTDKLYNLEKSKLNNFIKFDYMGSAEFEFGVISKSKNILIEWIRSDEIRIVTFEYNTETYYILCNGKDQNEIILQCKSYLEGNLKNKGVCNLSIDKNPEYGDCHIAWEVQQNFIITKLPMFILSLFCNVITNFEYDIRMYDEVSFFDINSMEVKTGTVSSIDFESDNIYGILKNHKGSPYNIKNVFIIK